jgi:hypothetical protein
MPQKKTAVEQKYRFFISPQDSSLTEPKVKRLLAQATQKPNSKPRRTGFGSRPSRDWSVAFLA